MPSEERQPAPKIGPCVTQTIDVVERILDCTGLQSVTGDKDIYPMWVLIQAITAPMYIRQGGSTVTLHATATRNCVIEAGGWQLAEIQGPGDAYFALESQSGVAGTAVGVRVDKVN